MPSEVMGLIVADTSPAHLIVGSIFITGQEHTSFVMIILQKVHKKGYLG